jgi:hypothetical protein
VQRVDVVDGQEIRIAGSKGELLRAFAITAVVETAAFGAPSFIPEWRPMVDEDENYVFAIAL